MILRVSKGHNPIAIMSYNCKGKLNYIMTSITLWCLAMMLPISLCYLILSEKMIYCH